MSFSNNKVNSIKKYLNDSDLKILDLTCSGKTSKEISRIVFLSPRTIEDRRAKIYEYFGVKNKTELIIHVLENDLTKKKPI
jgi:DNA-binding CsgD family transcriptional regulator